MDDVPAPDVDALGQRGIRAHRRHHAPRGQLEGVRERRVREGERRRARNERGHVGDTVVDDAADEVDGIEQRRRMDGRDAPTLVHRDVDDHGAFLHLRDHLLCHEQGRAGASDEDGADQ